MVLEGVELGQLQVDDLLVTAPGRLLGLCRSGLYGGFWLWRLPVRSRRCLCRFLGLGRFLCPGFLSSRWGFLLFRGRGCFLSRLFLLCRRLLLRGSRLVLCLFGRAALPLRRFRPLFPLLLWGCLFRPFGGFFFGRSGSRFLHSFSLRLMIVILQCGHGKSMSSFLPDFGHRKSRIPFQISCLGVPLVGGGLFSFLIVYQFDKLEFYGDIYFELY